MVMESLNVYYVYIILCSHIIEEDSVVLSNRKYDICIVLPFQWATC